MESVDGNSRIMKLSGIPTKRSFIHLEKLRYALMYNKTHPSTGVSSLQSSWAMEEILKE
jgi:hypothetical protein